jgi:glycosyltransferase involved in cell wall biosynthesis
MPFQASIAPPTPPGKGQAGNLSLGGSAMDIDLHVHSKHSTRPSQWVLRKIGCPESFTEPRLIYDRARSRGMSLVTITDHNTIEGGLEIAHLPGTFISEEITSYFPEDGCKVHVLALDIDEAKHADIQKARENVHDLVVYLRGAEITHILAHPLFGVNDKLTVAHFEKMLLLFKHFELNGSRDNAQNETLRLILAALDRKIMEDLADRHDIEPPFQDPWIKHLTGGSDDHGSLKIASMYTSVPGAADLREYLEGLRAGLCVPSGQAATPKAMARNLYSIAYQFYGSKLGLDGYASKSFFFRLLDRFLSGQEQPEPGFAFKVSTFIGGFYRKRAKPDVGDFGDFILHQAENLVAGDKRLMDLAKGTETKSRPGEDEWFEFVDRASNSVVTHFARHILDHMTGARIFNVFQGLGSGGALSAILAPYFVAYKLFAREKRFCRQAARAFGIEQAVHKREKLSVAHFSDTFHEINGVALTLRLQLSHARKLNKHLTVVTCSPKNETAEGLLNFKPIDVYELPEYPDQKLYIPPLMKMLDHIAQNDFDCIHSATPGPIGLAALAIARILGLPFHGTYHTAIPQYAKSLTDDEAMEELMWRYVIWYYNQMDKVFVPSAFTGGELISRGVDKHRIVLFPRGVDTELFHPAKRNGFFDQTDIRDTVKLLYVGRISKEKNLDLLANAFADIHAELPGVSLVIVGDGPHAGELKSRLGGLPHMFTGCLQGETLATVFASSDIFVFPSATDTFGNVVLEAQASGLPIIVTDQGGPRENVTRDVSGLIVPSGDKAALAGAVLKLARDAALRRSMGRAGRRLMEERSFEKAFAKTWELYR